MTPDEYQAAKAALAAPRKRPGPKPGDPNVIARRRLRAIARCKGCGAWRYGRTKPCPTCGERQ